MQPGVGYRFMSSSSGVTLDIGDPWPDKDVGNSCVPLKVKYAGYESEGDVHTFTVCVGTINNLVPQLQEDAVWVKLDRLVDGVPSPPVGVMNFAGGLTYIYLRCGKNASTNAFPSSDTAADQYPRIASSGTVLTDSDDYGYVLLAHGSADASNNLTLHQDVSGSLWGDRIKVAGSTARYYYARI